ncbi:MAG: SDR family oxidoreductase [Chloroflexi bacterium]|nr:SDR family oxidoreductase [Chloroflexota bacterium]
MILVTGATGNVASILIPTLLQSGQQVRGLVHEEAKASGLRDQGAEVVVADLEKPETLDAAVAGVERIYLVIDNGPNGAQHGINLIDAVKRSGGRPHVVRQGMFGDSRSRLNDQHEQVAAALAESGLPVTTLRPTFFMQNTLAGAQSVASAGQLYWAMNDAKLAMIDIRDIAECAAAVLTSDGHVGEAYILTGPQAVSFHDVANALSGALNKPVTYINVPNEALVQSMTEMGIPEWTAQGFAELMDGFKDGFAKEATDNVERLTGHPARSVETFAHDFAGFFGGGQG